MKICIVTPDYLPSIGGVEIVTSYLARGLVEFGHEVHIITINPSGYESNSEINNGAHIHRLVFPFHSFVLRKGALRFLFFMIFAAPAVIRVRPDVVHAQNFVPAVTAFISKVIMKIPYSVCIHTEKFGLNGFGTVLPLFLRRYWAYLPYIRAADMFFALTDSTAEEVHRYFRTESEVIPNGVDLDRFHPQIDIGIGLSFTPKIICISRLGGQKAKSILCGIQAMAQLILKFPQAKFIIVGDGPFRENLENLSHHLGLTDNVVFLGELQPSEIPTILADANIYLQTSFREGFSLTILEAMAAGLPLISTPVGIATNIREKWNNGLLVPTRDPQAICNAIIQLAENPEARDMYSQNSINCVKGYSWINIIKRYEEKFYKIIHN